MHPPAPLPASRRSFSRAANSARGARRAGSSWNGSSIASSAVAFARCRLTSCSDCRSSIARRYHRCRSRAPSCSTVIFSCISRRFRCAHSSRSTGWTASSLSGVAVIASVDRREGVTDRPASLYGNRCRAHRFQTLISLRPEDAPLRELAAERVEREAEVDDGAEQHVPGGAARAVEVQNAAAHSCPRSFRLT